MILVNDKIIEYIGNTDKCFTTVWTKEYIF